MWNAGLNDITLASQGGGGGSWDARGKQNRKRSLKDTGSYQLTAPLHSETSIGSNVYAVTPAQNKKMRHNLSDRYWSHFFIQLYTNLEKVLQLKLFN